LNQADREDNPQIDLTLHSLDGNRNCPEEKDLESISFLFYCWYI